MSGQYIFCTRTEFDNAVNAWIADETAATSTYGDINTWDVSAITNFTFIFSKNRIGVTAAGNFNSSLVVKTGGSLPSTPTIFPESINIYSKN